MSADKNNTYIPYTDKLAAHICEHVANGGSLLSYCKMKNTPARGSIYRWTEEYPEFGIQLLKAREFKADCEADEVVDLADKATPENYNAIRVMIDARKWAAAKGRPRRYGDKLAVSGDAEGGPLQIVMIRGDENL